MYLFINLRINNVPIKKRQTLAYQPFVTILSTSLIVLQPSQSNVVNMQKSDENPKEN